MSASKTDILESFLVIMEQLLWTKIIMLLQGLESDLIYSRLLAFGHC